MNLAEEARVLDDAAGPRTLRTRTQLDWLESEGVHILREVAGECTNPALLFSGGKDSAVVLRLAEKAFRPAQIPFTIVHIDTGHNFPEAIEFRDRRVAELGVKLVVGSVEDSIKRGTVRLRRPDESRNAAQSVTLLETIAKYGFDACIAFPLISYMGRYRPSGQPFFPVSSKKPCTSEEASSPSSFD